jgi:hypothetical protein
MSVSYLRNSTLIVIVLTLLAMAALAYGTGLGSRPVISALHTLGAPAIALYASPVLLLFAAGYAIRLPRMRSLVVVVLLLSMLGEFALLTLSSTPSPPCPAHSR